MKLTAQQIMDAYLALRVIANDKRPLPHKGAYRVARMLSKLEPDAQPILEQYDAMITAYNHHADIYPRTAGAPIIHATEFSVPADKMQEFRAKWKEAVGGEEHEVDVEPIPLDQLDNGTPVGAISAGELLALGELVRE